MAATATTEKSTRGKVHRLQNSLRILPILEYGPKTKTAQ